MKSLPLLLSPATPSVLPGDTSCLFVCILVIVVQFQIYFRTLSIRTERAASFIFMVDGIHGILLRGCTINYLTSLLLVDWMIYILAVTDNVMLYYINTLK